MSFGWMLENFVRIVSCKFAGSLESASHRFIFLILHVALIVLQSVPRLFCFPIFVVAQTNI